MKAGHTERVEVRIASGTEFDEMLTEGLRGSGEPRTEQIRTATRMTVRLSSSDEKKLAVEALSDATQLVSSTVPAHWDLDIKAISAGTHTLRLSVTCILDLDGRDVSHAPPVIDREIRVMVAPVFSLKRWLTAHWRWIVTTLVAVAGAVAAWVAIATG
jgi:hypothetical protein